jgi:hypothetical protein
MHQEVSAGVVGCGPVMGDGTEQLEAISADPPDGKANVSVAERASGSRGLINGYPFGQLIRYGRERQVHHKWNVWIEAWSEWYLINQSSTTD